ncbi:MAG: hypothetical protein E6Q40_10220 [Cupriavidus sp.]|nr:MAG: hypothetical protein E6Q40_10220 [Cupriavidus sp.]
MGTSTASSGPGSNVSLDPPWLDDVASGVGTGSAVPPGDADPVPPSGAPGDAIGGRYREARRDLSRYIKGGNARDLGSALGHYSSKGSGGAGAAATRMRASTRGGAELFSLLNAVARRSTPQAAQWVDALRATNPSADDVVDAIVRELAPPGGSADEESLRDSMARAMSDMVREDAAVDLLSMRPDDIWDLMKGYLAIEVVNRFIFDMGPALESSKVDPSTIVAREKQMRLFVKNEIGAHIDMLRGVNPNPTRAELDGVLQETLKMTFELFESRL